VASTSEQVVSHLEARESFVVEAGAGSGKTGTLIDALTYLLGAKANDLLQGGQQIVCITYTNVAVNEIMSRINRDPLVRVSTIHDFLWSVIGKFQNELRAGIIAANESADPKKQLEDLELAGVPIEYWQYPRKWREGKIHHDDVISLSAWMFSTYPKLARLVTAKFPIIFVDEYQDTHASTIELLLDVLVKGNPDQMTVGLFGDYMQKIYNDGVGKVEREWLAVIQKQENYRCSLAVIDVLNKLRPSLQQVPGADNIQGSARFFYPQAGLSDPVGTMRARLRKEGWKERDEKVLMLTRKGIAADLRWPDLLAAYSLRGSLAVDDFMRREDEFGKLFGDIEAIATSFGAGHYGDFLAQSGQGSSRIRSHADKQVVADQMARLNSLRTTGTVGEVLDFVWDGLLRKPTRVTRLEERIKVAEDPDRSAKDQQFLDALRAVPYVQVTNFERYLNDETPFSTNHGVKGEEYENVLVVLDDTLWNNYKFEAVLSGDTTKSQYDRSLNLFYVSCSRAKQNLVVLATSSMGDAAIQGAKQLFGDDNVGELAHA
jgi:DNA helicase II / ATP-dependent DNA helicase PcrA